METLQQKSTMTSKIIWLLVAIVGAVSFGILALSRGEHVNAVWLVLAAACVQHRLPFLQFIYCQ